MPPEPPAELVDKLMRLELATPDQVRRAAPRVYRLARDLPLFESVWIDALAQARVLTPYQAAELNAGRGDALRIGTLVLCRKLPSNGLGDWYIARDSKGRSWWRLIRVAVGDRSVEEVAAELEALLTDVGHLRTPGLLTARRAGIVDGCVWAACEHVDGIVAADWLAQNGRMPPEAVLEIARQMLEPLMALATRGRPHADLAARQLIVCGGAVALPLPCIRAIVRPVEGYSRADLPPEAFDGLAPERVLEGTPPNLASDLFALGCLWWHLLTGRTPLVGGDALSKLRAAHTARIADVRTIAPDTPSLLAEAIAACVQADPAARPASIQVLAKQLGEPSRSGKAALARSLGRSPIPLLMPRRRHGTVSSLPQRRMPASAWLAAAAMALLALAYITIGQQRDLPLSSIAGQPSGAIVTADRSGPVSSPSSRVRPVETDDDSNGTTPPEVVLSAQQPQDVSALRLKAAQKVRGRPGERPLLLVPAEGLVIECEDVTFENVDFVRDDATPGKADAALIQLRAYRLTLRGCSFQSPKNAEDMSAAIAWRGPVAGGRPMQLPTGSLELVDCSFRHVAAAIDCGLSAAVRLELVNCLHLGPGPLLKQTVPRADEPCLVILEHCTLREAAGVVGLSSASPVITAGEIEVRTVDCALLPAAGRGLLELAGSIDPFKVMQSIRWTGQGSLLGIDTPVAVWRPFGYAAQPLPEEQLSVSGLVRSQVEFAGPALSGPEASRLVRWQAPLRSADPPGITDQPLFLPAQLK